MKISKIKLLPLILTVVIVSAIILSCGGNSKDSGNDDANLVASQDIGGSADNQNVNESENVSEPDAKDEGNSIGARPDYDLPEKNLNGYNFRILSRGEDANIHWWNYDITAAEDTGDPINDALFERNRKVEELYNVKITNIPDSAVGSKASRSIKAGSDDYDLVVIGLRDGQENLISSGYLQDLHNMPYVDLTKPWWDQKAVEQLSMNNKLFATTCDMTIRDKDAVIIMMFNKDFLQKYELEDPYSLVLSGKWTFDKMYGMMRAVSLDLNGDGKMDDEDQYGLLTQLRHTQYLFNAAGEYVSKLNADKIPEITMYSEKGVAICEKIREFQGDKNYTICAEDYSSKYTDVWDGFQVPMFAENKALFYHAGMNRVTLLRTMENDFGILPPPKYDENQSDYYAAVDAWCTSAVSVPITVSDKETTGLILETLAYESRYLLLPAYYDINLKTKFARDEESSAMIDIILNNRLYDLGDIYYWGNMVSFFESLSKGRGDSLTTYWDKNGNKIIAAMEKTMEKINSIE